MRNFAKYSDWQIHEMALQALYELPWNLSKALKNLDDMEKKFMQ